MKSLFIAFCLSTGMLLAQPAHSLTMFGQQVIYVANMTQGSNYMTAGNNSMQSGDYEMAVDRYVSAHDVYLEAASAAPANSTARANAISLSQTANALAMTAAYLSKYDKP